MFETFHTPERLPAQNLHVSNFHRQPFWTKAACKVRSARSWSSDKGDEGKELHQHDSVFFRPHHGFAASCPYFGEPLPPGVICPFKKVNTHWQECWQSARFLRPRLRFSDPAQFHGHASPLLFETHCGYDGQTCSNGLVLCMDSGGGSLLHLTVETGSGM